METSCIYQDGEDSCPLFLVGFLIVWFLGEFYFVWGWGGMG